MIKVACPHLCCPHLCPFTPFISHLFLETAKESIKEHPNYLGYVSEEEEGWYHYRFHINDDENREVKLSLMLFHIPE